jgi:hypothetical protein
MSLTEPAAASAFISKVPHNNNIINSKSKVTGIAFPHCSPFAYEYEKDKEELGLQNNSHNDLNMGHQTTNNTNRSHNNNHGWMLMSSYWCIGMLVGVSFGYLPSSSLSWARMQKIASPLTYAHAAATAVTIGIMPRFYSLYSTFGRTRSVVASALMATMNGICETMIYLAVYDLGAVLLLNVGKLSKSAPVGVSPIVGFLLFYIYSAFIHRMFWDPLAFPKHIMKPRKKPFYVHGLPEVTLMSISWMALYASTKDVAFICVLHCLFNFCGAMMMGLQLPSFQKGRGEQ